MNRSKILRFRVTEQEDGLLKYLSHQEGLNRSEFVRLLVRKAAKARKVPVYGWMNLYVTHPEFSETEVNDGHSIEA